ncbi:MAG TPA: hypothetical protein VJZ71_06210 [Phycisphaerae bacterium]|nr:hypothetical protein [Phycisphaerae bacterium]
MKNRPSANLVVIVLAGLFVGTVEAQELFYLKSSLDSQASAASGSARELLDELLAQPAEIRNAVLEAAQHPELLVRLKYLDISTPGAAEKLLSEYPPTAAEAARLLLANPPLLKKVGDRIVAAGLLGQMYAKERDTVRQMADQVGLKRAEQSAASAKAWHERLASDQAAGTQLRAVIQTVPSSAIEAKEPVGTPGLHFPTGEQAAYVLANADQYPELAAQVVDQWERERNPDGFRGAVDYWYAQHRQVLPHDLLLPPTELVTFLKEHAVFERRYQETAAISGPSMPDRATYLEAHLEQYPALAQARQEKIFAEARAKRPKVVGGPYSGSSKGGGSSSGGGLSSSGDSSMRSSRSNSMRGSSNRSRSRSGRNDNDSGQFGGTGGFNDSGFGGGGFGNRGGFGNNNRSGGSNSFGSGGSFGGSNSSFGSGSSRSGGSRFGSRQSGSRFGNSGSSSNNNR